MELIAKLLLLILLAPHLMGLRAPTAPSLNLPNQTAYIGETEKNLVKRKL